MRTATVLVSLLAVPASFAQQAISVQSGMVHHIRGQVEREGAPLTMETGKFPMVEQGQTLTTRVGLAEVLLTPGVFLRLGAESSMRMLQTALTDTRLEIASGSALVEVVEMSKFTRVGVRIGESETVMTKPGLYQFDASARRVSVFDGRATVSMGGRSVELKGGRQAILTPELAAAKFDGKSRQTEPLYAWSRGRADLLAQANVSAATALRSSGYRMNSSMWTFFPGMGLMTFLPYSGYARSAFGWGYYSPSAVWQYYAPRYEQPSYGGGRPEWSGMGGGGNTGYSPSRGSGSVSAASVDSGRASAPAAASAPAVSAPSGGRGR